jgi:hypothetical protein
MHCDLCASEWLCLLLWCATSLTGSGLCMCVTGHRYNPCTPPLSVSAAGLLRPSSSAEALVSRTSGTATPLIDSYCWTERSSAATRGVDERGVLHAAKRPRRRCVPVLRARSCRLCRPVGVPKASVTGPSTPLALAAARNEAAPVGSVGEPCGDSGEERKSSVATGMASGSTVSLPSGGFSGDSRYVVPAPLASGPSDESASSAARGLVSTSRRPRLAWSKSARVGDSPASPAALVLLVSPPSLAMAIAEVRAAASQA